MTRFPHLANGMCLWLAALCFCTAAAAAAVPVPLTDWEQIHQTLHTYPLAIDQKDFGRLAQVFTPTATANYTGPLARLRGLPAIQAGLAASVAHVDSQHLLGTTVIDIHPAPVLADDSPSSPREANSTTYFQATLFGRPFAPGELVTLYGFYADHLVDGAAGWRIDARTLVFQGPGMVGNLTLLGE